MSNSLNEFIVVNSVTLVAVVLFVLLSYFTCGCAYKGGKVVDGTNLAIGMKVPGTDWNISILDYVGGVRVAGNDSTRIIVSNEVFETNTYFGCVSTKRHTRMTADIAPTEKNKRKQQNDEDRHLQPGARRTRPRP